MRTILVIIIALCVAPAVAYACRCLKPQVAEAADRAKVVFAGTISDVRKTTICNPQRPKQCDTELTYTVKVDGVFKGSVDKIVKINPGGRGLQTSCHTSLGSKVKNTRWLFFMSSPKQPFFLLLCDGTQRATDVAIETITKKLGTPKAP
ncbi:MAG TPA: hypothetical protein VIV11_23275 [Kofleriaceae bacterium]